MVRDPFERFRTSQQNRGTGQAEIGQGGGAAGLHLDFIVGSVHMRGFTFVLKPDKFTENEALRGDLVDHGKAQIEIGDTFKNPRFRNQKGKLRTFDRVVANLMWNQDLFTEADYDNDELDRFPAGAGFPGKSSADWGWVRRWTSQFVSNSEPTTYCGFIIRARLNDQETTDPQFL